jgi:hypothetical protein
MTVNRERKMDMPKNNLTRSAVFAGAVLVCSLMGCATTPKTMIDTPASKIETRAETFPKKSSVVVAEGDVIKTHGPGWDLKVAAIDNEGVGFTYNGWDKKTQTDPNFRENFDGTGERCPLSYTRAGVESIKVEKAEPGKVKVTVVRSSMYNLAFETSIKTESPPGSTISTIFE